MTTDNNAILRVWADATDYVRDALTDVHAVEFEWPGNIDVYIDADTLLTYGSVNETINANISRLVDGTFQPDESALPDSLVTDLSSECTDPYAIADAIIDSVRLWRESHRPVAGVDPARLAQAFVDDLRANVSADQFEEIRQRNVMYGNHACASHDFIDANECMAAAFRLLVGRESNPASDADSALWNAAWHIAKRDYLTA